MVRGENQPGKPFHRCVDPVHSDVLHPRCRFGIRGVWFGDAIVMDRRSGSLDGLAQDMAGMDSGHRQLRFRGVVRQDIRHGAGQSGRHHRHLPRIALSGVGHIPTCRRNRRAGCDSGFGTRPDRSGQRTSCRFCACRNVSYTAALPACVCSRCCRTIGVHSASHAARVASATAAPSNASSRKHSACSSYPSDVERNSPPPWKRADSDPTRHEAKRADRNCMRSTGCSTPSASRCRQSRWPPHIYTGYWHWAFSNVSN